MILAYHEVSLGKPNWITQTQKSRKNIKGLSDPQSGFQVLRYHQSLFCTWVT